MHSSCSTFVVALSAALQIDAPVSLAVDISELDPAPLRERRTMTREAAEIWAGHGVAISWIESAAQRALSTAPAVKVVQRCEKADGCEPLVVPGATPRLGAVLFLERKLVSERRLFLAVETIREIAGDTRLANRRVREWPAAVRQELAGRAMGRVLAHEIGHYLLAWRTHTATGLLRVAFRPDRLVDPDRSEFRLSQSLLPRLRARLAQLDAPGTRFVDTKRERLDTEDTMDTTETHVVLPYADCSGTRSGRSDRTR